MARTAKPKITSADFECLITGAMLAKRGSDFSRFDKLLARRVPEKAWRSAHGDDLYFAGRYFQLKAMKTQDRVDLAYAKRCFAAAYERLTQNGRDEALLEWANVLLENGTVTEKRNSLEIVRNFARDFDAISLRAATTLTLLSSGDSPEEIEANLAIAQEAIEHWKVEVRDLEQAVREGKSMLRYDVRVRKKLATKKRATKKADAKKPAAKKRAAS